jgi:hypothetical protein
MTIRTFRTDSIIGKSTRTLRNNSRIVVIPSRIVRNSTRIDRVSGQQDS